jgi:hypothetical protein
MFKVTVSANITATPGAANSAWSKAIRALQVTSEIFAVFPAAADGEGGYAFTYLAPDFNTNTGAAAVTGSVQSAITQRGGNFSVVESALVAALGGTATVIRCMVVGDAVVDEVAPV